MSVVTFMAPLWRLAGNPAFEASQQQIFDRLAASGLQPRYEAFANSGAGWDHSKGTVRLGGPGGEIVLSRDEHRDLSRPGDILQSRRTSQCLGVDVKAAGDDGRKAIERGRMIGGDGQLFVDLSQRQRRRVLSCEHFESRQASENRPGAAWIAREPCDHFILDLEFSIATETSGK